MGKLGETAMSAGVGGVIGTGLGMINSEMQNQNAEKMQNLQIKGQKELGIFNRQQQMKLWEDTNYKAQSEQMKKAGLNIGLMYGAGGGGGGSTNANPGVVGSQKIDRSTETGQGMQMGLMTAQTEANIELTKAQTNLANVEANKKGTVDTDLGKTQISSITQGIENAKTANELQIIEKGIKEIELEIDQRTKEIDINRIGTQANEAIGKAQSAMAQGNVDTETRQTKINSIRQSYVNLALEQGAIESGIKLTNEQINQVKGLTENYIKQVELGTKNYEQTKAYQESLIKLGYSKIVADAITNVASTATRGLTGNTTSTEHTSEDNKGNWRESRTTTTKK